MKIVETPFPIPNDSPFFVEGMDGPEFKIDDGQSYTLETIDNWPQNIKKLSAIVAMHHYSYSTLEETSSSNKKFSQCKDWLDKQL